MIAAAAIRALHSKGLRIPQDISVMGFDDIPLCEMVDPAITTVHSFKERLGIEAVQLLHRRIMSSENVQSAQTSGVMKLSMSTRIVERSSVADLSNSQKLMYEKTPLRVSLVFVSRGGSTLRNELLSDKVGSKITGIQFSPDTRYFLLSRKAINLFTGFRRNCLKSVLSHLFLVFQ